MAVKKTIEIEAKVADAVDQIKALTDKVGDLEGQLKDAGKESQKTNKILGGLQNLLRGGLGLVAITKAFEILQETFSSNQKVVNLFNTGIEALSLAFNDLFSFLNANVGTVVDYFKDIFDNPMAAGKRLVQFLKDQFIERINSSLEALGFLGEAVVKVFQGDFAGAAESAKNAGKELVDVVTGVDNTFDKVAETLPTVVDGVSKYVKSTVEAAAKTVELNRAAEVGIAQNRIILEQKDREAEKLRQLRDDDTKNIEDRIKANNDLKAVLDEQEDLMLKNADAIIAAAQAQYDKNGNDENYIALLEARAEKEGILAQIEGFRSEQISNAISLEKEKLDLEEEALDAAREAAEEKAKLKEEEKEGIKDNIDAIIDAAGQESAIGKAVFVAKQAMRIKEQIEEAKATLQRITLRAAEAQVDTAKGAASTAKVGFPQNIPLLIAFAAQAAGIIASVRSAVGAVKQSASGMGGVGGGSFTPEAPAAPAFNIVGASPINQVAQAIGQRDTGPIKAYVVGNDVTNQQALDRQVTKRASLG